MSHVTVTIEKRPNPPFDDVPYRVEFERGSPSIEVGQETKVYRIKGLDTETEVFLKALHEYERSLSERSKSEFELEQDRERNG